MPDTNGPTFAPCGASFDSTADAHDHEAFCDLCATAAGAVTDDDVLRAVITTLDAAQISHTTITTGGNCQALDLGGILITDTDAGLPSTFGVQVATDHDEATILFACRLGFESDTAATVAKAAGAVVGAVTAYRAMTTSAKTEAARHNPWPETDAEREMFQDWTREAAEGSTASSFRDWLAAERDRAEQDDNEE